MDATTSKLARFAASARYEHLSASVVHDCRRRLIDSLACAAGAAGEPYCETIRSVARSHSATPPARLWGSGERTSMEMAAFANGTQLRYLDFSDTFLGKSAGHPSDMIGALVAVAEAYRCDWAALATSIAVAYEVYCGLCDAVAMQSKGVDQATAAAVGSAAGVGSLLGFDEIRMGHALALALAPNVHLYNVRSGTLSDWKGSAGPNAARSGVFAAQLAQKGVTGPSAVIEGPGGLQTLVGAFDWQVGGQGQWLISRTHLKFHPVCYHGQSAVDAALALRGSIAVDDIDTIEIATYDAAVRAMGNDPSRWAPTTRETADHSLPYTVAVALLEGRLSSDAYAADHLSDPRTRALMAHVRVAADADLSAAFPTRAGARLTLRAHDGRVCTRLQDVPRGHAANPLTDDELGQKFISLYRPWGDAGRAQRVLDRLWTFGPTEPVATIVDLLCRSPGD